MKILIASDIHGSAYYCRMLLEALEREKADRLFLLGDILYHGPRNDLPERYAPKEVLAMLNPHAAEILCVRGNCDCEVDQMVLDFPIMAEYALLDAGSALIFATHGHVYNPQNPPVLPRGSIVLCGHTHIPVCKESDGITYLNPGSVSIPKNGSAHSYMIYENGAFVWKELLTGEEYQRFSL